MFEERDPGGEVDAVRADHAPGAIVLDAESEFETLDPRGLDALATRADGLDPASYPAEWLPDSAPDPLPRIVGPDLVVGLPEHGSVTWTRATDPPMVIVRPRARGSPEEFVEFLIAEALVQVGSGLPEGFLPFFGERYRDLAGLAPDPAGGYQLAAALFDAYVGLHTRPVFRGWAGEYPRLHAAWEDAGGRLEPRLADLPGEIARGETGVAAAAEYACSAVKHGLDLPAPFAALDTAAYREHGAGYALQWAEKVLG